MDTLSDKIFNYIKTQYKTKINKKEILRILKSQTAECKETFTITFGDKAENHAGMQCIGNSALFGYSKIDLIKMQNWFINKNLKSEVIDLSYNNSESDIKTPEAYLLIVKNGASAFCNTNDLFNELKNLKWDSKAFMKGRVVNKHARHNLCFGDKYQSPDYENKKGTIIDINTLKNLKNIKNKLKDIHSKNKNLVIEGNYYYDINKCGIGFHGDSERKKVIGIRVGATSPIVFKWYHNFQSISPEFRFELNHGDLYVMCSKAVGTDWKKSSIYTLRHSAGCDKYTK